MMAWNPSPGVAEARDIAQKHGDDMVIVLRIQMDTLMKTASYGRTKGLCAIAGKLADSIHDHIDDLLAETENRLIDSTGGGDD